MVEYDYSLSGLCAGKRGASQHRIDVPKGVVLPTKCPIATCGAKIVWDTPKKRERKSR